MPVARVSDDDCTAVDVARIWVPFAWTRRGGTGAAMQVARI
jgi:hypothetical protein